MRDSCTSDGQLRHLWNAGKPLFWDTQGQEVLSVTNECLVSLGGVPEPHLCLVSSFVLLGNSGSNPVLTCSARAPRERLFEISCIRSAASAYQVKDRRSPSASSLTTGCVNVYEKRTHYPGDPVSSPLSSRLHLGRFCYLLACFAFLRFILFLLPFLPFLFAFLFYIRLVSPILS